MWSGAFLWSTLYSNSLAADLSVGSIRAHGLPLIFVYAWGIASPCIEFMVQPKGWSTPCRSIPGVIDSCFSAFETTFSSVVVCCLDCQELLLFGWLPWPVRERADDVRVVELWRSFHQLSGGGPIESWSYFVISSRSSSPLDSTPSIYLRCSSVHSLG